MLEKPDGNVFDVTFYNFIKGQLVEICKDKVIAVLPSSYPLNEYLQFVVEMSHYG